MYIYHQGFDVGKKNFANNYFISVHISLICDHINRRIILALNFQLEQYELNKITSSWGQLFIFAIKLYFSILKKEVSGFFFFNNCNISKSN